MTIAAHVTTGKGFHQDYLLDQLIFLAKRNPADHIIIFAGNLSWYSKMLPSNITPVIIRPAIKNRLLLYYWYNYRLPSQLDRYNADVFIGSTGILTTHTSRPQFLYFSGGEPAYADQKKDVNFVKKRLPRFIELSRKIFFSEEYEQSEFQRIFPHSAGKSQVVYHGIDDGFRPLNHLQKLAAVTRISREHEYFLVPVTKSTVAQLTMVLKAFSIFKKWQKSSMKLVLLLYKIPEKDLVPNFHLYKYREEVIMMTAGENEETRLAIGGAYGCIYMPVSVSAEPFALNALSAKVPVITTDTKFARSLYANAALYSAPEERALAEQLQLLYKDENLKSRVIQNAHTQTAKYDLEKNSTALYDALANNTGM